MAVYYCGALKDSHVLFGNGTALLLKGIESRGRIIQPRISESVQSYYCAVVTCGEISNGNGTKEDSTGIESRGRIIQPRISESVQSYYCAVVTCGEISNGNGTKEDSTGIESRGRIIQPRISESVQSYYCAEVKCGEDITGNGAKKDGKDEIPPQHIVHSLSVTAQLGESVTLECSVLHTRHITLAWFKEVTGQPPVYIVKYDGKSKPTFFDEFNDKSRFKMQSIESSFNLTILKVESSDMAVYYCAALEGTNVLFGTGTVLLLKGILKG
ncbi:UNVERIFIED_CONTAM: hypothetical protein FKN15_059045 [Acipenser sinensis]